MAESLARSERQAYKAHIKTLEEQLAWTRSLIVGQVAAPPMDVPMESGKLYTSEDEEEAHELHELGIIDQDELKEMLDAAGALSTEIDFSPTH